MNKAWYKHVNAHKIVSGHSALCLVMKLGLVMIFIILQILIRICARSQLINMILSLQSFLGCIPLNLTLINSVFIFYFAKFSQCESFHFIEWIVVSLSSFDQVSCFTLLCKLCCFFKKVNRFTLLSESFLLSRENSESTHFIILQHTF